MVRSCFKRHSYLRSPSLLHFNVNPSPTLGNTGTMNSQGNASAQMPWHGLLPPLRYHSTLLSLPFPSKNYRPWRCQERRRYTLWSCLDLVALLRLSASSGFKVSYDFQRRRTLHVRLPIKIPDCTLLTVLADDNFPTVYWSYFEGFFGILALCLPVFRPFLNAIGLKIFGTKSSPTITSLAQQSSSNRLRTGNSTIISLFPIDETSEESSINVSPSSSKSNEY